MKDNIPEFKKRFKRRLKEISDNPEFITGIGSLAGQTEKEVDEMIDYIDSNKDLTESDIVLFAVEISYKYENSEKH